MNDKSIQYRESHPLRLNVYLLFYVYVFAVIIMANVFPVSELAYFVFLFLGITGMIILVIKFSYSVSIRENTIELSIKIPFKVTLLKLKKEDIKSVEKTNLTSPDYSLQHAKKGPIIFCFEKGEGIKITMLNGKIFIISGINAEQIINLVK